MTGEEELAVRQARGATALAREFIHPGAFEPEGWSGPPTAAHRPCSWGDDAWHRAVTRLGVLYLDDFQRFLAEERGKTAGERP